MPLSYFRRPLAVALLSYMLLLALLHCWGFFQPYSGEPWLSMTRPPVVRIEGIVTSGFTENRLGERVEIVAGRPEVRLMAYLPRYSEANARLRPGQRVVLDGKLRLPRQRPAAGGFDERKYLADRGVAFVFRARRVEILEDAVSVRWLPVCWAETAHRSIHDMLRRTFAPDVAAILEGFLIGYKGPLDSKLDRAIQDSGVMHLLVPSGAKVAFVMAFFLWFAGICRCPRQWRAVPAGTVGGFYVLVVGAGPPYVRAYLGVLIGCAARTLDRESTGFQALVLSAFLLLIFRPLDLFTAGFQMSYAAALGLLIAMPRWAPPSRWPIWARRAVVLVTASAVVQMMLAPIMARVFGRVSLIGVLANLFFIPASGLFVALGFLLWGAFGAGFQASFRWIAAALNKMAAGFAWSCAACAAFPAAAFQSPALGPAATLAYYAVVIAALSRGKPAWARRDGGRL